MAGIETETPLDLSSFDDQKLVMSETESARAVTVVRREPTVVNRQLAPEPPPPRLVEVAKLSPNELAAAEQAAARINFRNTASLLSHGDGVLAQIAQASRQLLSGIRLGDAGEIGGIAAAVIDGVKLLRIEDLQAEADGGRAGAQGAARPASGLGRRCPFGIQELRGEPQDLPRPDGPGAG